MKGPNSGEVGPQDSQQKIGAGLGFHSRSANGTAVKAGVPPKPLFMLLSQSDRLLHCVQLTQILSMFQSSNQENFGPGSLLLVYLCQWSQAKPQPVPAGGPPKGSANASLGTAQPTTTQLS